MLAILSAPGSRGDVHPMVAIGRELKNRGHDVVISLAEPYVDIASDAGLEVESVIDQQGFDEMLAEPGFWKPVGGARKIFHDVVAAFIAEHDKVIRSYHHPGETVLVSHPLDLASRVFRETDPNTPLVDVQLAPSMVRTYDDPARLSPWWFEVSGPPFLLKSIFFLVDRLVVDPLISGPLEELRRRHHSLPPVKRILDQWWLSPDRILAMYPKWFAPATSQYSPRLVHCGFPLQDFGGDDFTAPTNRPIVFTSGTAHHHCRDFFQRAAEACTQLDHPGLFVSSHQDNFPASLPENVETLSYVSFADLLPQSAAIVHHGGIGTTSQAFAAGIPQLVRALAFDQFDNATKVERLGCGRWLRKENQLANVLATVLDDAKMSVQCKNVAEKIDRTAISRAVDQIEACRAAVLT